VFEPTVTETVYTCVLPSCAVTVYVTGEMKLWAVPLAGLTVLPLCVTVGVSDAKDVPNGTVNVILLPLIVPIEAGSVK